VSFNFSTSVLISLYMCPHTTAPPSSRSELLVA
jgi:hypothetical protein